MSNFTRTRPLERDPATIEAAADAAEDAIKDAQFEEFLWACGISVVAAVAAIFGLWVRLS